MTTTPDYRAELQALYDDVTAERWDAMAHRAAIERAQAALAAPEAVGVTDEELLKTYRAAKAADIQRQGGLTSSDLDGFVKQIDASALVGLRAVLARYGAHPAPVPVGERLPVEVTDAGHSVADYMRSEIDVVESCAGFTDESTPVGDAWSRILGAMERSRYGNSHPAPVPVGERPGVGDCTTDSECWWWDPIAGCWFLLQGPPLNDYTHWLPHWALPLPEAKP